MVILPGVLPRLGHAAASALTQSLHRASVLHHHHHHHHHHHMHGMVPGGSSSGAACVLALQPRTLSDVLNGLVQLGEATGAPQAAAALCDRLGSRLRRVAAAAAASAGDMTRPPRVLVVRCVQQATHATAPQVCVGVWVWV